MGISFFLWFDFLPSRFSCSSNRLIWDMENSSVLGGVKTLHWWWKLLRSLIGLLWEIKHKQTAVRRLEGPRLHSNSPSIIHKCVDLMKISIHNSPPDWRWRRRVEQMKYVNELEGRKLSRGNYFNSMLNVDLEDDSFTCTLHWTPTMADSRFLIRN